MPSTYTLISSNVLSSTAASVTFSAIPSTYTDLVVRLSLRDTGAGLDGLYWLTFNGSGGTAYSNTFLYGYGTGTGSGRAANQAGIYDLYGLDGSTATANTYASSEIYIPSYTVAQNKPISQFGVPETNAASFSNGMGITAGLWRNTAAITSLTIQSSITSFASTSSFYLYGIKNS